MLISRTSQKLAGDEFIIKKLLNDLKSKLPFKKKLTDEEEEYETEEEELEDEEEVAESSKRTQVVNTSDLDDSAYELSDDDEEEEDNDEDEGSNDEPQNFKEKIQFQIDQLRKKITSLTNKKKDNADDEVEEVGDEDQTQADITHAATKKPALNKNKLIIQGVIVLGLLYFVADEFLKEDEPQAPEPQLKARPDKVPTETVESGDTPNTPDRPMETETPSEDTTIAQGDSTPSTDLDQGLSEAIPGDDTGLPDFSEPTAPDAPVDSTSDSTFSEPHVVGEGTTTMTQDPITQDSIDQGPPVVTEDSPMATDDSSAPSTDTFSENGMGQGDIYGDLASPIEDSEGDLTEKILQDLENQTKTTESEAPAQYVAPPDYEYPGRGLVYNCKALHWACIDGPSYKTCEQNAAYQKGKNKKPECYPFNIYETSKGCTAMQNRMVSSGANTDFCKGF